MLDPFMIPISHKLNDKLVHLSLFLEKQILYTSDIYSSKFKMQLTMILQIFSFL